ncbi:protein Njmu-R1-like [Dermacentor albipictus]|uniref:protein Njmu-R1-like n=1 Tax=Dermacentor albipictus TaxID=60249 RepID=UPI0038FC6BFE
MPTTKRASSMDSTGYDSSASTQSNQSSASALRGTFYAVYLYTSSPKTQQQQQSETETSADETSQKPVATKPPKSQTKESLSLLATDLGAIAETDLRCFLIKKVARDLQDTRGNVDSMEMTFGEKTTGTAMCFHQAFTKESSDVEKKEQQAYVLCFIAPDDGTLDLYCTDLERFGKSLLPLLTNSEVDFKSTLTNSLEEWHYICVLYTNRCVEAFAENIAVLLQAALSEAPVNVTTGNSRDKSDVEKFMEACNLHGLESQKRGHEETESGCQSPAAIEIVSEDDRLIARNADASPFCQRWAARLMKSKDDGPLVLRRIVEGFKIRTIQNLNLVKRLVKEAENDHYALFNAYQFLKKCGYWETLLQRAINEGSVVATPDGREVVDLLQERLAANALAGSQLPVRNSA